MYYEHSPVEILHHIKDRAKQSGDTETEKLCLTAIKQIEHGIDELNSVMKELQYYKISLKDNLAEIRNQLALAYDFLTGLWEVTD